MEDHDTCPICNREDVITTKHHLIPIHKKGKDGPTVDLCTDCHDQIHALWDNNELRDHFNTLDLSTPELLLHLSPSQPIDRAIFFQLIS